MTELTNQLLFQALKPLQFYYERDEVEEIAINNPGFVWLKTGNGWEKESAPEMDFKFVVALCRILANVSEQDFDKDRVPILSATLPGGHRFQAMIGTNVRYDIGDTQGICLCIRRFKKEKRIRLEDYQLKPGQMIATPSKEHNKHARYSDTPFEDLIAAVEHGEAVLISGATASGKTTFLNALVEYVPHTKRVVTVEDTREIMLPQENRVHLVVSRTQGTNSVDYNHVLDSVVRLTPDVIIAGEISVGNVKAIYRLMTTGHSNFFATIHADSPEMAVRAFWQNLTQADLNLDPQAVLEIISCAFGRIVQIDRSSNQRIVTGVEVPALIKDTLANAM